MKNKTLYLGLFFASLVVFSAPACWSATTTISKTLTVNVPDKADLTLDSSGATGTISTSGVCSGMYVIAGMQVTGGGKYYLVMTGTAQSNPVANAFSIISGTGEASNNFISLVNVDAAIQPTDTQVQETQKQTPSQELNPNVIAYPLLDTIVYNPTGNMTINMVSNQAPYTSGIYSSAFYRYAKDAAQEAAISGSVKSQLDTTPHSGTFSADYDEAGRYQATVTLSALPKD